MAHLLTQDQCDAINKEQREGHFHPLTCGGNGSSHRGDDAHKAYAAEHGDRDWGLLVARPDGLHCPVCGYHQTFIPPLPPTIA